MDWDDLRVVLAICRAGTLSGAARLLDVNHSTVFRRINAIEKKLEVRLFDRQPTGYVMTEAGEAAKRTAERIDADVDGLSRQLIGRDLRLQGPLKVTSPEGIGLRVLLPGLTEFCRAHPEIEMDLVITSSALRLSRREADVAVRVTGKPPDNYIGRRICKFRFCMYATPDYLDRHGHKALEEQRWVLTDDGFNQLPPGVWKGNKAAANVIFSSNSDAAVVDAARSGLGITPLPCFRGDAEADLVRFLDPLENLTMDLWVLTHPDLRRTARVTRLMTFLCDILKQAADRFEGAWATERRP